MRTLDVYLDDTLVGFIAETRKGGRFAYTPETVERLAGSPVLSLSLPAKRRPFGEAKTSNWFNGLLPEGPRRDEVCRSLGISPYDWMGLLAEIGWECAGAVRVFPRGRARSSSPRYREISKEELAASLSNISLRLPRKNSGSFRMSLGGFQEKMCVCMPKIPLGEAHIGADGILLPEGDAASTHILKPENARDYPGSAESEAWALLVASRAARCSRVSLLSLEDAPSTLVIERYDRTGDDWPLGAMRVHQEDACQALGIDPSDKYANSLEPKGSDPTYKAIADLLVRHAEAPEEELAELVRQMTVNLALGNWDAHAKNTSFLYEKPRLPTVAPLYDVVPIAEVEPRTRFLSMRIDGLIAPEEVRGENIVAEAVEWGVAADEAKRLVVECLEHLREGIIVARGAYPGAASHHEGPSLARVARLMLS